MLSNQFVMKAATLGIDYGTSSARAVVVRCTDGAELGSAVFSYPSGTEGVLLDPSDPHLARQSPSDHLVALKVAVTSALSAARKAEPGFDNSHIVGIGVDTTGSSPLPVDDANVALGMKPKFASDLAAQCWLWKDHTAHAEAARITEIARKHRPRHIARCGGSYSSEWFWSKIWHCLNTAPEVFHAASSWIELSDWIPAVLCGIRDPRRVKRNACAAGHKALYAADLGGLPDSAFFTMLDPALGQLRERLYERTHDAGEPAGVLCEEWATELGLAPGIPVAMGELDVHYGSIGSGVAEGVLVKVIGTSTCDCTVLPATRPIPDIPGICGIVQGAILPGFYGVEAGQSAVGDIFNWWVGRICRNAAAHEELTAEAARLRPGESGLLALDWNNGNRNVLTDPLLSGLLVGQTLHTTPAEVYRTLIEATAFGARMILERLCEYGVEVSRIVCAGGIAENNPLLMQIYADVTGREMSVTRSSQACALGAAIAASVVAGPASGGHADFASAQRTMTGLKPVIYRPDPQAVAVYDRLFDLYRGLHDAFGGLNPSADLGSVMKALLCVKTDSRLRN